MAGSPSRMLQAPGKGRSKESPLPGSARDGLRQLGFSRTRSKHNQPIHQNPTRKIPFSLRNMWIQRWSLTPESHFSFGSVLPSGARLDSRRHPRQKRSPSAGISAPPHPNPKNGKGINAWSLEFPWKSGPSTLGAPAIPKPRGTETLRGFFWPPQRTQGLSNGVSPFPQLLRDNRERLENPGMCFGMRFPGNRPRVFRGCSKQINLCS